MTPRKAEKTPPEDLRMSSADFDRIMGQALQVKPEKSPKKPSKVLAKNRKKNSAR